MIVAVRRMKYVSSIMPWLLPPAMFSVVVAAVYAWKTDSLQILLLFVVLPLAIWIAILRSCRKQLRDPAFAPSFVTAVVLTDVITFIVVLRPAISAGLEVALGLATVNLLVLYWRIIHSDPGRFPVCPESSAWTGGQERAVNPQLVRSSRLEGWDIESFEGEPLKVKDLEIGKGESHPALENSETDGEEAGDVVLAAEEYSATRFALRSRYCRKCNAWIDHFDHHCPAIKNCVGRKNHVLFLGALVAFIVAELLYVICCYKCLESWNLLSLAKDNLSTTPIGVQGLEYSWLLVCQVMSAVPWVTSTALFAAFQASWQIPLLLFHVYCASVNLTTSEWIKWERYSYLYIEVPPGPGRRYGGKKFVNPYDQGILINLRQFLQSRV